jgi:hypothetical protein
VAKLQRSCKKSGGRERERDNPVEMGIRGTYSGGGGRGRGGARRSRKETGRLMRERETYSEHDHTLYFLHQALCNTKVCKLGNTTPFRVVISVTCAFCKGPKLDAEGSRNVTLANCQYDSIRQKE